MTNEQPKPDAWLHDSPYPKDVRGALFGGSGAVSVWDLQAGRPLPPFSAALACELEPGGHVGTHVQQRDPELVLCAQGDGEIEVEGHARDFGPGEMAMLPHGSRLAIRNRSATEPLRYFIIKGRAS